MPGAERRNFFRISILTCQFFKKKVKEKWQIINLTNSYSSIPYYVNNDSHLPLNTP